MKTEIENIELSYLNLDDYLELKEVMQESYKSLDDSYWEEDEMELLIDKFPDGQVVVKVDGEIAGCALSMIVDYSKFTDKHTYKQITGNYSFDTIDLEGDMLYGIDVFIKPKYRGMRLARRLYDFRKELCEKLNLKGIVFGGRIPNYHLYSDEITPKEYIEKVKRKEINDPVFNFQISNDFYAAKIVKNYLDDDVESNDYAVILKWENLYYEEESENPQSIKRIVRLGLVQWQMRPYNDLDQLMEQAEFFVESVSNYHSDFALFPEFFNAPLMANVNHLSEPDAIRDLANYTDKIVERFSNLAISYNINIITGSMPVIRENRLYNIGYLCKRDGSIESYEKIHVTPDEAKVWGMERGNHFQTFDTDCGKIGILICYDVEFPELSRLLAMEGMNILFVPFLTDTQNGYSRVRNCAQARAIENECYVAIAGSVGNLPNVHNMDIQYAQSMVFTPCDFAFPANGIKAEATPNTEMTLIVDLDLDLLKDLHHHGSVHNLKDRREDVYSLRKKMKR